MVVALLNVVAPPPARADPASVVFSDRAVLRLQPGAPGRSVLVNDTGAPVDVVFTTTVTDSRGPAAPVVVTPANARLEPGDARTVMLSVQRAADLTGFLVAV